MNDVTPTTRLCLKCDAAVPVEAAFCPACGAKQGLSKSAPPRTALKEFVAGTVSEAKGGGIELLKNKDVQKIAAGAALGAAIAPVIPFISIPLGATLGAGYVLFKRITR